MQIDPSLCNNKNVATSSSSSSTSSFTLDSFGSAAPPQSEIAPKIPPAPSPAAPPPVAVASQQQQPVVITVAPLPASAPIELPTGAAPAASIPAAQIVNMAGAQLIKVVAAAPLTNPTSSSSVIETTPLPATAAATAYTVAAEGGGTQGPAATTVVLQNPNVQRLDEGHPSSGESLGIVAPRVFNLVTTNQKTITTLPAPKQPTTFNNGQQRIATVTALPSNARVIPASTVQTPSGQKVQILGNVVVSKQNILLNKTLAPQRQLITTLTQSKPVNNNNNPLIHKPQLAPQVKTIKTISRQTMPPQQQQQQLQSPQKTIKTLSPQSPGGGYAKQSAGIKTLSPQNNHYAPKNQLKMVQANRIGGIKTIAPQRASTAQGPAASRPPPMPNKTNYIGKHAAQAQKSHATKSRVAQTQGQQQRLNHSPKYQTQSKAGGGNNSQSNFNQSLTAQILQSLPSVGGNASGRTMPLNNEHMYHGPKNHSMQSPTEVGEEISPEISPNLNYIHQVIMLDHNYHAMPPEDTPPTHRQSQQNNMNGIIPSQGQSASYYGSVAAGSKRHGRHPSTSVQSQSNLQQSYHHSHQPQPQYHHPYHPQSLIPSNQPPSSTHLIGKTSQLPGGPVLPDRSHQPVDDDAASTISSDAGNDNRFDVDEGEETETAAEGEGDEEGITKCICDFDHDDGFMICCDICSSWQHVECMGFTRDTIPEKYSCVRCVPRRVDRAQARAIQQRKREEFARITAENAAALPASVTAANSGSISDSSSDTSTAESTGDGPAHSRNHSVSLNNNLVGKKRGTPVSVATRRKSEPVRRPLAHKRQQRRDSARETVTTTTTTARRTMKKREKKPLMKRKMKSRSSVVDYDSEDSWLTAVSIAYSNMGASLLQLRQWIENYEEAVTNHYSPELRARLNNMRANGVSYNNNQQPDKQAPANAQAEVAVQKCKVANQPLTNIKIVMSTQTLAPNAPVIELMGKYMLSTQHRQSTGPPGTADRGLLTRHTQRPGPFLFFYRLPRDGTEVCVDTRTYGNDARFIRRSCKPNAELRHCVEKCTLHLYVITLTSVDKNSELTIKHESHDLAAAAAAATTGTPVQIPCACGNPQQCGLVTNHRKNGGSTQKNNLPQETTTNATVTASSNPAATENTTTTHRKRRGRRASSPIHRPPTPPPAPAPPTPKITSPPPPLTSPVAAQPLPSPIPPAVPAAPPALSTRRASSHARAPREPRHSISSDHDEPAVTSSSKADKSDSKDKDKKLTREERKMEAIMKAFERLEKQEQRKQEQSARQAQRKETDPIPGGGSTTTGRGDDIHHGNARQNHQNGEIEREGVRTRRKKRKGRSRTISTTSQTSLNRRRTRLNSTDSYLTSDEGSLLSPPLPMPTTPAPEPTTTSSDHVRSSTPDLPTKQDQTSIKPTTTTTPPMTSPVKTPATAPPIGDMSSPGQINTAAGLLLALANGGAGAASTSTSTEPQTVMAEPNIINKSPEADSNSSGSNSSLLSSPLTPTLSSACLLVAAALGPVESSGFKFPKTEYKTEYKTKKAIMNHWLNKSPELTLPAQPHGHDATAEPSSDFYNNNNSAAAILTSTMAATTVTGANKGLATLVQAASLCDSPPQCAKVHGAAGGNAKKRWLRQAMAVTAEELDAPCSPSGSPPTVTAEMVAPPKKRRLARASLSSEQSFTPPSTPTMLVPPANAMAEEDYHNNDEEFYTEDRTHSEFQKPPSLLLKDPVAERLELLYSGLNHQSPPLPSAASMVVPGAALTSALTVNQMRAELDCVDSAVIIKEPRDILEYETLKRDGLMDTLTNKFPDTLTQMMDPRLGRDRPIFRDSSQLIGTLEKTIRFYEENLTGPIPQTTPAPLESPQPAIPIPPAPQPIIHEEPVCIPIVPPPAVIPPPIVVTPLVSVVAPVPPPPVDTSPVPVLAPPKFKLQGKPEMVTPAKRKLSISEYRQRKQLTTPANEKGSGVTTPERSVSPETTPTVTAPAPPVASVPTTSTTRILPIPRSRSDSTSSTTSSLSSDEELPNVSTAEVKTPAGGEPQVLVAFNSAPTAVELQRENVERLKKAFGLALDDESKKRDIIPRDISPKCLLSPSTVTTTVASVAPKPLLLNTSQPAADLTSKTELATSKFISSLDIIPKFPVKRPLSPEPYGRDSPAIKSPRIDLIETVKDDETVATPTAEVKDSKTTEVTMEAKVTDEETRAVQAAVDDDEDDEVQFDEDSFIPPFNNPVYPNSTQFTSYPSVIDSSPYEGRNPSPPPSELLQISK